MTSKLHPARDSAYYVKGIIPLICGRDSGFRFSVHTGVAFLGDLFFNGRFPWFGDCDLNHWISCLDRVLRMKVETVIPGHGPPASLKEAAAFRDLLAAVRDSVGAAIDAGLSEDAAAREVVVAEYVEMQRYKEWMPFNVRAAYRYMRGG